MGEAASWRAQGKTACVTVEVFQHRRIVYIFSHNRVYRRPTICRGNGHKRSQLSLYVFDYPIRFSDRIDEIRQAMYLSRRPDQSRQLSLK